MEIERFKGWIPVVSGRLSFSVVGQSSHPSRAISVNKADADVRYIVCFQKRETYDSAFPFFTKAFANIFLKQDAKFWYFVIAKVSNKSEDCQAPLQGSVFVFHDAKNWKTIMRGTAKSLINEIIDFNTESQTANIQATLGQQINTVENQARASAILTVKFEIKRNGETWIEPIDTQNEITIPVELSRNKQIFGNEKFQQLAISQVFFFLKDITHHHQHHHPRSDTIVDIYRSEDDVQWRVKTLKALYHKALLFRRDTDALNYTSAQGVLAYISSFIKVSAASGVGSELLPLHNEMEIISSLNASKSSHDVMLAGRQNILNCFNSLFFAASAMIFSVSGVLSLDQDSASKIHNKSLFALAELIINHPALAFGLVVIIFSLPIFFINRSMFFSLEPIQKITKLIITVKKKYAIFIFMIITFILGFSTYAAWQFIDSKRNKVDVIPKVTMGIPKEIHKKP